MLVPVPPGGPCWRLHLQPPNGSLHPRSPPAFGPGAHSAPVALASGIVPGVSLYQAGLSTLCWSYDRLVSFAADLLENCRYPDPKAVTKVPTPFPAGLDLYGFSRKWIKWQLVLFRRHRKVSRGKGSPRTGLRVQNEAPILNNDLIQVSVRDSLPCVHSAPEFPRRRSVEAHSHAPSQLCCSSDGNWHILK